ncbi:MAG: Rpp14/Pop5 family protein [Aigarchaeota archaeon]|nr:Rpp14/Pop5 family protein [Candidatus Pelearchaeum maunauluense]
MSERVLRLRRRYVAVCCYPNERQPEQLWDAVRLVFVKLFGELALIESGLRKVRSRHHKDLLIIACYHSWLPKALAAITLVKSVNGMDVSLDVITVSGTIRALRRRIVAQR